MMKMETKNWKQIIALVGCILGGIVTGIIITAYHLGKTEGRIFPVAILTMAVGALIASIIKYLKFPNGIKVYLVHIFIFCMHT